jgi:signal transduction histidine kinase
MRYRAVAIGGRFTVTTVPAGGTLVSVQYPEGANRGQELKFCA